MFLGKYVLRKCSKFMGEHSCRSVISINLQSIFIEITLQHECSPVNLLHIFRAPFPKNTCRGLLLSHVGNSSYLSFYIWMKLLSVLLRLCISGTNLYLELALNPFQSISPLKKSAENFWSFQENK